VNRNESIKAIGFFVGCQEQCRQAEWLVNSIRRNIAEGDKIRIVSMVPEHLPIRLGLENVEQVGFHVPEFMREVYCADKVLGAAAFEQTVEQRYLWMDVDGIFLREPEALWGVEIRVNPVDKKNIGELEVSKEVARDTLWQELYRYFGISEGILEAHGQRIRTTVTNESIYPYYNMGMISFLRQKGLFRCAADGLVTLLDRDEIRTALQKERLWAIFFHQAVLSCALIKLYPNGQVAPLPYGMNYPLHLMADRPDRIAKSELISLRYDDYFDNGIPSEWEDLFHR